MWFNVFEERNHSILIYDSYVESVQIYFRKFVQSN